MTNSTISLTFPAKPDYLVLSRLALAGVARVLPLDPDTLADLKLAITEACGNAVKHAYDGDGGPVTVSFTIHDHRLQIVVEDRGSGIDAPADGAWEMPDEPEGGMGMAIIKTVVDELEVSRGADGKGTVVRMTKHLTDGAH